LVGAKEGAVERKDDTPVAQKAHLVVDSTPHKPRSAAKRHATARLAELGPDVAPDRPDDQDAVGDQDAVDDQDAGGMSST
jgi:hypothetical protein